MTQALFETQRTKAIKAFQKANLPFLATTRPYESTRVLVGAVVNPIGDSPNTVAFLVYPAQEFEFFSYGIGDSVAGFGSAVQPRQATPAETNLAKGKSTNGAEDFIVEGMSLTARGHRVGYPSGSPAFESVTDAVVRAALRGEVMFLDQAAIYAPPQVYSPFNLEDAITRALLPQCSVEVEFDRRRKVTLGTLEEFGEGGGNSYLRSNGQPSTDNKWRIPEGLMWRRDGQPDSELIVRGKLENPVVFAVNVVTDRVPAAVATELKLRLHGISLALPSVN